jgi:phage tail-like protein
MSDWAAASPSAPVCLGVSHVADSGRRHPGEAVTFHTRVEVTQPVPEFTLQITLPPGLSLEDYRMVSGSGQEIPIITRDDGSTHLYWTVKQGVTISGYHEYRVTARVAPTPEDRILESRAVVTWQDDGERFLYNHEIATVTISTKGQYLKYLPAIYQEDDLMGRLLMLFESFWAPIETQIDGLSLYFDPCMTPSEFLPWLASWLSLVLDQRWPEERQRQLLRSAVSLYRRRGTKKGLEDYVEIYTGTKPRIVEHRAYDFRLGSDARLGPGIALGTTNKPHTFTVHLSLPPIEGRSPGPGARVQDGGPSPDAGQGDFSRQELERRHKIEAIVEAEKPAHTSFTLVLDVCD